MPTKLRVGILGATGTVGQRFIQMLQRHPQFEVTVVAASERSENKPYAEACSWRLPGEMPSFVRPLRVQAPQPPLDCDLIFSSLPAGMAQTVEEGFARAGYPVISNSSAFRMQKDIPLLIPEVNHAHLRLLDEQRASRGFANGGLIVTNLDRDDRVGTGPASCAVRNNGCRRYNYASSLRRGISRRGFARRR